MNLLEDPWIPVRADFGAGTFQLLTYQALLCEPGQGWHISLPRDDLELACLQLLVCMTQVMFLPEDDDALRNRIAQPLLPQAFHVGIAPCQDWFDLDHPTQPFMQSRCVRAERDTAIQKLLIGLPEGNNHAFFNEVGEIGKLSAPLAAITLFNQASNANSMGGGFKGNLRGGTNPYLTPVNIFVAGRDLRETIWKSVLTESRVCANLPGWQRWGVDDLPTWVKPIAPNEPINATAIGLCRGLFWQPVKLELMPEKVTDSCDVLNGYQGQVYRCFKKEQFKFSVAGLWPHPHGAKTAIFKDGKLVWRYSAFKVDSPAWTQLSEFVVARGLGDPDAKEGSEPSGPVAQAEAMGDARLHLWVGGYCAKQGSVVGRRHEMISLAHGWQDHKERLPELVSIGKDTKQALYRNLLLASKGYENKKKQIKLQGIGAAIHETAEKLFYARTESLIHMTFSDDVTFREWGEKRNDYGQQITQHCRDIFEELTRPYATKPELIPIVAWSRRELNKDLKELMESAT